MYFTSEHQHAGLCADSRIIEPRGNDLFSILVVDDQKIVRDGLRSLLSSSDDWAVCGEAQDGLDAIEKAKSLKPDIVLMDISMPRMDGIAAIRVIRQEVPESDVIIIGQNDPAVARLQAAEVKASGYVGKASLGRELVPVIREVLKHRNGATPPSASQASGPLESKPKSNERENAFNRVPVNLAEVSS